MISDGRVCGCVHVPLWPPISCSPPLVRGLWPSDPLQVIEEAPAPGLSPEFHDHIGQAAGEPEEGEPALFNSTRWGSTPAILSPALP